MSLLCRTCSEVKLKLVNLFSHYNDNCAASEILNECTSVQIQEGDGLPLHICIECWKTLISAWHFRRMTIESDGKLRKIFWKRKPDNNIQNKESNMTIVKEETIVKSEVTNPLTIVNNCVNITDTDSVQINQENAISFMETNYSNSSEIAISACNEQENFLPATCSNQCIESCNVQQLQHTKETSTIEQLQYVIKNIVIDHSYASNCYISTSVIGQKLNKSFMINNTEKADNLSGLAISGNNIQRVFPIEEQLKKNDECNQETSKYSENEKLSLTTNIDEATLPLESMDISYHLDEKNKSSNSYFVFQGIKDDVQQESTKPEIVSIKDNINNYKLNSKPKKLLVLGEYRKLTSEELAKVSVRCKLCNKVFGYRYYYHVHLCSHKGDLPYKCNVCDKRFVRPSLVKAHALMHLETRPFTCDLCEKTFKTVSALQAHKRVHWNDRPYKCDLCKSSFKRESILELHKRRHENQKDQICETGGKTFIARGELSSHLKSYSDIKNYLCTVCGKAFRIKGRLLALRYHMRTHTGEARYACKVCPSRFKYSQQLTNHMKYHK